MNLPLPAAPHGPPPRIPPLRVSTLLKLSPSGQRLPAAVRAALSTGIPVATGWAAGDLPAGLMASIGAFTSLYASDRPYLNRALVLAGVALSLALAVSLGVWAQQVPQMVVPVVVAIAMVATFICNSLSIGPPGAYMFALACAAGTAMPASHLAVWQVGLLVLSGGAISWIVHMAAALIWPRGPEKTAIVAAADAVAHFAEAAGTAASEGAQHTAALALHNAWATLLTRQPARPAPNGCLTRLRALNRELHLLFVACLNAANQSGTDLTALAEQARRIGASQRPETSVLSERTRPKFQWDLTG